MPQWFRTGITRRRSVVVHDEKLVLHVCNDVTAFLDGTQNGNHLYELGSYTRHVSEPAMYRIIICYIFVVSLAARCPCNAYVQKPKRFGVLSLEQYCYHVV